MKALKLFATASMAVIAISASSQVADDRIDIYTSDKEFTSIPTLQVKGMTFEKADPSDNGYSTLVVNIGKETRRYNIADAQKILYTPLNIKESLPITWADSTVNGKFLLLDCMNNADYITGVGVIDPNRPIGWRGAMANDQGHYMYWAAKGHKITGFHARGLYSNFDYATDDYFSFESAGETNTLGVDCIGFNMPFEPLEFDLDTEELTTFEGRPFLGDYHGYWLDTRGSWLTSSSDPEAHLTILSNGLYKFKTTEENNLDIHDLLSADTDEGYASLLSWVEIEKDPFNVETHIDYGAEISFITPEFAFVRLNDVNDRKHENERHYFVGRGQYDYVCASYDGSDYRQLVEVRPAAGGAPIFFYLNEYGHYNSVAQVDFKKGSSLAGPCTAIVTVDDQPLWKYVVEDGGSKPVFTARGAEAGTYTCEGKPQLTLDGFGFATYNGSESAYEAKGNSIIIEGAGVTLIIDRTDNTYKELAEEAWSGPKSFSSTSVAGEYNGQESTYSATLLIDAAYNGSYSEGTAKITVKNNESGVEIFGAAVPYTYDAANSTFVLSNIWLGSSPTTIAKQDLVIKIANDKQSVWFDDSVSPIIYGIKKDGSFINAGPANKLQAK